MVSITFIGHNSVETAIINADADDIRRQVSSGVIVTWGDSEDDPSPASEWAVGWAGGHISPDRIIAVGE